MKVQVQDFRLCAFGFRHEGSGSFLVLLGHHRFPRTRLWDYELR